MHDSGHRASPLPKRGRQPFVRPDHRGSSVTSVGPSAAESGTNCPDSRPFIIDVTHHIFEANPYLLSQGSQQLHTQSYRRHGPQQRLSLRLVTCPTLSRSKISSIRQPT
jgi:hypothetical protein